MSLESSVQEEYNRSYSKDDVDFFKEHNISAQTVNSYKRHLAGALYQLVRLNCPPEIANKYHPCITSSYLLYEKNILPKIANGYMRAYEYFREEDIIKLVEKKFSAKKVREYRKELRKDAVAFAIIGCEPEHANAYSTRFLPEDITELFKAKVDPTIAAEYDSRFDGRSISMLWKSDCSPRDANKYNKRFNGAKIVELNLSNVSPSRANKMHPQLDIENIIKLVDAGLEMPDISKYPDCWWVNVRTALAVNKVPPEWLDEYDTHFKFYSIETLMINNIDPKLANQFHERFDGEDISFIVKAGCTPEEAAKYHPRFKGEEIKEFVKQNLDASKVNQYSERFDGKTIAQLISADFSPSIADKYTDRFKSEDVGFLAEAKCLPELAGKYDQKFSGKDIADLFRAKINPKKAAAYPIKKGSDISRLVKRKITPNQLQEYMDKLIPGRYAEELAPSLIIEGMPAEKSIEYIVCRDNPFCIEPLYTTKCPPELARFGLDSYDKRFDAWEVATMYRDGCMPEIANQYDKEFKGQDIGKLYRVGCMPEMANLYYKGYKGDRVYYHSGARLVALMYSIGIKPVTNMTIKEQKNYKEQLSGLFLIEDLDLNPENYQFMTTGSHGVILTKHKGPKSAWKLSINVNHEYESLKEVYDNNPELKNVVKVRDKIEDCVMQLEHIKGESLGDILTKNTNLTYDKISKYSNDILNGLMEIRNSKIRYHRDINPRNIVIDYRKDRAVIIDLEHATKDINQPVKENINRRFNGPNDLSSLGQLMYYMATGTSVFTETKEHAKDLLDIADEIKRNRNIVYNDKFGRKINEINRKIDSNIENKRLGHIIKQCLVATHTDYERIHKLFKAEYK